MRQPVEQEHQLSIGLAGLGLVLPLGLLIYGTKCVLTGYVYIFRSSIVGKPAIMFGLSMMSFAAFVHVFLFWRKGIGAWRLVAIPEIVCALFAAVCFLFFVIAFIRQSL
jgi:hypothetical protein